MTGIAAGALEHAAHRTHTDGEQRRAADPARPVTQPLAAVIVGEAARHRVHDGDAIGAGIARHDGHRPDIRENRRELGDEGKAGARAALRDDLRNARGVGTELDAAGAGVGAGKVQFIRGDAVDALEALDDGRVLDQLETDDVDDDPGGRGIRARATAGDRDAPQPGPDWPARPS